MNKDIFKSERCFMPCDIVVNHGQLLLRSLKDSEYPFNIDITFFDTRYIQLVSILYGITIRIIHDERVIDYKSVNKYLSYKDSHLFEIESGEEKYYIAASFCRVFENQLESHETSLGFEEKGRKKVIASSLLHEVISPE